MNSPFNAFFFFLGWIRVVGRVTLLSARENPAAAVAQILSLQASNQILNKRFQRPPPKKNKTERNRESGSRTGLKQVHQLFFAEKLSFRVTLVIVLVVWTLNLIKPSRTFSMVVQIVIFNFFYNESQVFLLNGN